MRAETVDVRAAQQLEATAAPLQTRVVLIRGPDLTPSVAEAAARSDDVDEPVSEDVLVDAIQHGLGELQQPALLLLIVVEEQPRGRGRRERPRSLHLRRRDEGRLVVLQTRVGPRSVGAREASQSRARGPQVLLPAPTRHHAQEAEDALSREPRRLVPFVLTDAHDAWSVGWLLRETRSREPRREGEEDVSNHPEKGTTSRIDPRTAR